MNRQPVVPGLEEGWMKRILAVFFVTLLCAVGWAGRPPVAAVPFAAGQNAPAAIGPASPEFLREADEVLAAMSKLLDLPVKAPLKKSIRSKQEIRAYLIRQEADDKDPAKRHADERALEAFGLIPKGFPLESYLLDLLTDQVAGLYDPKAGEFYIADWIPPGEQEAVMAHELTHALDDQYFHLDRWEKAARPNDDAELAREAVVEGSALAAMLDFMLREQKVTVRTLPDISSLIRSQTVAQMGKDPKLAKAPMILRDELLFPYLEGSVFTQQVLKANSGWGDFRKVFENPPVSTQQILHPELYLSGKKPRLVPLPGLTGAVPARWKKLDENTMGEFGLHEVLKRYLGEERAAGISPAWAGDRYAIFEDPSTGWTLLVFRLWLSGTAAAQQFFSAYSDLMGAKYASRTGPVRRPWFYQFDAGGETISLRCVQTDCLVVEGGERKTFAAIARAFGLPLDPPPPDSVSSRASARARLPAPLFVR